MDALGKALAVLMVSVVILTPFALADDSDAADTAEGLLLYQVNPYDCEGVAVKNYGSSTVNMSEYTITDTKPGLDNEGSLSFDKSITVAPGQVLVLVSDRDERNGFSSQDNTILYDSKGSEKVTLTKSFNLANSGDDVYLYRGSTLVDAVCYGNTVATQGWSGPAVDDEKDHWIQRMWDKDTDTSYEWKPWVDGWTYNEFDPDYKIDATVTPFLFPDNGGIPLYRAIESAESTIRAEVYQISNKNVIALLCQKAEAGVDVDVLMDCNRFNTSAIEGVSKQLATLAESGADVRFIETSSGDSRFHFDHAKYVIIDGDTTVVTSENWTTDNLNGRMDDNPYSGKDGNRGWGAVIESAEYAMYMNSVFENDWSTEYGDVKTIDQKYPNLQTTDVYYESPTYTGDFPSYRAKVTPVLSNENSFYALSYYASQAQERLYSQQQSLSTSFDSADEYGPIQFFAEAAERGVDTRLIFSDQTEKEQTFNINATTNIAAAYMTSPYVHNKGVVADDVIWVSSVNWTPDSFFDNRECCVVIESKEIADFFATAFLQDFDRYYDFDGFRASLDMEKQYASGQEITVTVTVSPENGSYTYRWDLGDGSDPRTTDVGRIVARPADGTHTMTVVVTDTNGEQRVLTQEYTVGSTAPSAGGDDAAGLGDIVTYLSEHLYLLIVVIVLIVFAVIGAARGGSKKGKKGKKKR